MEWVWIEGESTEQERERAQGGIVWKMLAATPVERSSKAWQPRIKAS